MIADILLILVAFGSGIVLGLAFFGSLWWTIARVTSGRIGTWLLPVSSLVRTALLFAGFWLVAHGKVARLVACLAGWLLARSLTVRRLGSGRAKGGDGCT
jgi:F1F0 ATPase subunit 2